MEPFQDPSELEVYKRRLGFQNAYCNYSAKIWIFWDDDWKGELISNNIQQITMSFDTGILKILISAVYARCDALDRLELQENLESIAEENQMSWLVGGDFNVILNNEEKQGGSRVYNT